MPEKQSVTGEGIRRLCLHLPSPLLPLGEGGEGKKQAYCVVMRTYARGRTSKMSQPLTSENLPLN